LGKIISSAKLLALQNYNTKQINLKNNPLIYNMKLLAHITYYSNDTRADLIKHKPPDSHDKFDKNSQQWRDHVYQGVLKVITTMNNYSMFEHIDVVVNMNPENTYDTSLPHDTTHLTNINIKIDKTRPPHHPYFLTTVHRNQMKENLQNYDWFLYTEDDNLVPKETLEHQMKYLERIYHEHNYVIGTTRMVVDNDNNVFYSDIQSPSSPEDIVETNYGSLLKPTNTYSGCWMYPQSMMKDFIESPEWSPPPKKHMIREKMAWGFKKDQRMIMLSHPKMVPRHPQHSYVYHLGFSHDYYFRKPNSKCHSLPKNHII